MERQDAVKKLSRKRKPPGVFHHGNLRKAAIDAAVSEVQAHGHSGLSVKALANKLGVAGPALYRHFKNRGDLLQEVAQIGYESFEARLTEALAAQAADPWQAILAGASVSVESIESPGPGACSRRSAASSPPPVP
jgi:AcrR family transcriptional regulator